jgi:hypothetical protein
MIESIDACIGKEELLFCMAWVEGWHAEGWDVILRLLIFKDD